jgi:hypothetical protein
MKIEYSLTLQDFKAIWNYSRGYTKISSANARVWYVAAPTISFILLLSGTYSGYVWLQTQGGVLLFASLVSIPIHIAFDKWKFSSWLKNNSLLDPGNETYSLTADDEQLFVVKTNSIETRLFWNAIENVFQNEAITIMYLSPDNYFYFPTKAMTVDQRAELDELVAQHLTRRKP